MKIIFSTFPCLYHVPNINLSVCVRNMELFTCCNRSTKFTKEQESFFHSLLRPAGLETIHYNKIEEYFNAMSVPQKSKIVFRSHAQISTVVYKILSINLVLVIFQKQFYFPTNLKLTCTYAISDPHVAKRDFSESQGCL